MLRKIVMALACLCLLGAGMQAQGIRWTEKEAADWYAKQPWLVGSNYIPANAINELEMWQGGSLHPQRVAPGWGWGAETAFNNTRLLLFDSCWDPEPRLGKQHAPRPGVHNSGWVQSPGAKALQDPAQYPRLEAYVKGVVGAFAIDDRVLGWDLWNEPDNGNGSSYKDLEPKNNNELV